MSIKGYVFITTCLIFTIAVAIGLDPFIPIGASAAKNADTREKVVALTFDDGPSVTGTPDVLAILSKYDVKATFFLIGSNTDKHADLAKRIFNEGHQVAVHSFNHSSLLPFETPYQERRDASSTRDAIRNATGAAPLFYRPPHGRLTPVMRWAISNDNFTIVNWSIETQDWKPVTAEEITSQILSKAKPGSIILLHDGINKENNPDRTEMVKAIDKTIPILQKEGYKFVTIAELFHKVPYENSRTD